MDGVWGVGMGLTWDIKEVDYKGWHGIYTRDEYITCLIMIGPWLVCNSLKSLGGVSRSCFSGRDVISWPLLVGVHGGAPSI